MSINNIIVVLGALGAGVCFSRVGVINPEGLLIELYNSVGVTIFIFLPLICWAIYLSQQDKDNEYSLSYIGLTAQRVGLLGTVIGVVHATIAIKLDGEIAQSIKMALPAVGQALISTGVGFLIALVCDFMIYINHHSVEISHEVSTK